MAEATNPCLPYSEFSRHFWGAKFLNGYEAFDFSRNPMTTGVEVEFIAPMKSKNHEMEITDYTDNADVFITNLQDKIEADRQKRGRVRERLAQIVQRRIQEEFPNIEVLITQITIYKEYEYIVHYELNGRTYEYAVKHDGTIKPPPVHIGVELNSPKLYTQQDINLFYDILRILKTEGNAKTSYTAGVHVHIGFPEAHPHEIALALSLFAAFEQQIHNAFSVLPERRRKYAEFTEYKALSFLRKTDNNSFTIRDIQEPISIKGHGLNIISSFQKFGTVEFRLFNSSLSPRQIGQMIDFAQSFIRAIREKDPKLVKLVTENRKLEDLPFEQLAEAIGMETPSVPSAIRKRRASATR